MIKQTDMPEPSNPAIRAKKAITTLIKRAKNFQLITYNDLAEAIGYNDPRPTGHVLWAVFAWCVKNKTPALSRLVISQGTGNPGIEDLMRYNLFQIYSFNWDGVNIPSPPEIEMCKRWLEGETDGMEWENIIAKFSPKRFLIKEW
jgi:hypothetical protein